MEHAFLVKCYYACVSNQWHAFQRCRSVRGMRWRPMASQHLRKILVKFESPGLVICLTWEGKKICFCRNWTCCCISSRGRNSEKQTWYTYSLPAVACQMHLTWSTVYKIVRKMVHFYTYKIKHVQELRHNDPATREPFDLEFLRRMAVDKTGHGTFCVQTMPIFT